MADYFNPLERFYYGEIPDLPDQKLSEPIIPISSIGPTIPEKHPATGGHILQNVQSAIRAGAKTGQIVMSVPSTSAMGGRAKAYGKEVREALKEVMHANQFNLIGVEMPTSTLTNLSGFDPQRGGFSDAKLNMDMIEVRDAMKFVADIAEGGSVDVWSQELPRTIFDQEWAKDEKGDQLFRAHEMEEREAFKLLIDQRTGQSIAQLPLSIKQKVPQWRHEKKVLPDGTIEITYVDKEGNPVHWRDRIAKTDVHGVIELEQGKEDEGVSINDYRKRVIVSKNKDTGKIERLELTPEELYWNDMAQAQINQSEGLAVRYNADVKKATTQKKKMIERIGKLREAAKTGEFRDLDPETRGEISGKSHKEQVRLITEKANEYEDHTSTMDEEIRGLAQTAAGSMQQAQELRAKLSNTVSAEDYGLSKSMNSYAELGVFAMQETKNNPKVKKDLYVGPELGWPTQWGGHPDEFISLIKGARKKMVQHLTDPMIPKIDPKTGRRRPVPNPNFDPKITKEEAQKKAKQHIKGMFDTGHMGMWLDNYRHKKGESSEDRIKSFNKWYLKQVDNIIKADVIGGIQVVDSATGAHGHLPAGQGIFPTVEAVKKFKEAGYDGAIISEGHEEEHFTHNRILTQAWKEFGSPISGGGYPIGGGVTATGPAYGRPWANIDSAYFGRTYTPFFIVGAYAPSNEWKLWSEVPFE